MATIYTDVVKDLGDLIATKLEMKLDAAGASGDLAKTVRIIRKLLGKMEGKPLGSARAAGAGRELSDAAYAHTHISRTVTYTINPLCIGNRFLSPT